MPSKHIKWATIGPSAKRHFTGGPMVAKDSMLAGWLYSKNDKRATVGPQAIRNLMAFHWRPMVAQDSMRIVKYTTRTRDS